MRPAFSSRALGARLHLPRDLHVAYVIGRMGTATSLDVWPLFYGSPHTARFGFLRLQRLGVLRMFPRKEPTHPGWFTLTAEARPWVAEAMNCDESELRVVSGIARTNLAAVRGRNRLWVSLVLSCRSTPSVRLMLFRPEAELRRERRGERLVPDALFVLRVEGAPEMHEVAWFVELDAGTERLAIWVKKAEAYSEARRLGSLYGEPQWNVLVVVPSERRARSVARVCAAASLGHCVFLAVQEALEDGHAFDAVLMSADELAKADVPPVRWTLTGDSNEISEADQRGRSTADVGPRAKTRGVTR